MRTDNLYPVLKAALLAGLAAGLVMGIFHFVLTEPVIDRAIALEEAASASGGAASQALAVSRGVQKAVVVLGTGLYGVVVGIIFAVILVALKGFLPGWRPEIKAAALAGILWWSVGLLPSLKYPAGPPGVGDPETVYFRQGILLGFIALSALAVVLAGTVYWWLGRQRRGQGWRLGPAVAVYGVLAIVLYAAMPANPDPVTAPADLVRDFRFLSLAGQVLFWAVLGGVSFLLLRRLARQGGTKEAG